MAKINKNISALGIGVVMILLADNAGAYATAVLVVGAVITAISGRELLM